MPAGSPDAPTHTRLRMARADTTDRGSSAWQSQPAELLAEAAERLGWAGLIYAATYFLAYFGPHVITAITTPGHPFMRPENGIALVAIGMGVVIFWLSRTDRLTPERMLDVGLGFEVLGALGIATVEYLSGVPVIDVSGRQYYGVPWEAVWIIIFPLVAPNMPAKVLAAALLAATTGPAVVWWLGGFTGGNGALIAIYFLFTNYLCAVLAYVIAKIVYRYGVRLKKARDIGSYELVRKIGQGGMGEVWVGRHRMLARPAAVKLIRPELLGLTTQQCSVAVRRFEREAQATAALRSTHTIHIYDFGTSQDGAFYYVMEFLEGLTLDALVRKFGPIPPARAVYLLVQACHSLQEAHAHGLVHRDIKPANIFTCRLGPDCDFVKVLDFGLVKHAAAESGDTSYLTAQGVAAGTPAFMAPEIALGRADIDGRVDLYALGCVAFWLVTGRPVFSGPTPMATALAHVQQVPDRPSLLSETPIPAALDDVILACLAKNPEERPASADDLARRLLAIDVPAWTPEDARKWWALHGPLGSLSALEDVDDGRPEAVVYAER